MRKSLLFLTQTATMLLLTLFTATTALAENPYPVQFAGEVGYWKVVLTYGDGESVDLAISNKEDALSLTVPEDKKMYQPTVQVFCRRNKNNGFHEMPREIKEGEDVLYTNYTVEYVNTPNESNQAKVIIKTIPTPKNNDEWEYFTLVGKPIPENSNNPGYYQYYIEESETIEIYYTIDPTLATNAIKYVYFTYGSASYKIVVNNRSELTFITPFEFSGSAITPFLKFEDVDGNEADENSSNVSVSYPADYITEATLKENGVYKDQPYVEVKYTYNSQEYTTKIYYIIIPRLVTFEVTCTQNDEAIYSGDWQTVSGFSVTKVYDEYGNDVTDCFNENVTEGEGLSYEHPEESEYSSSAERRDVGTTEFALDPDGFTLVARNFEMITTTDIAGVTVIPGYITINPVELTVETASESFTFDGEGHSNHTYEILSGSLVEDEIIKATFDESSVITNVAQSPLKNKATFVVMRPKSISGGGEDMLDEAPARRGSSFIENASDDVYSTMELSQDEESGASNYKITVVEGELTMTPMSDPVIVTITGHNGGFEYNNQEHVVSGYDVEISNSQYTEADFSFSGNAQAKRTEKGITYMGLNADQFQNNNTNFNVTFNVTDGFLTVAYHIGILADNADNTATICSIVMHNDGLTDIILKDRTLYKDGHWNTLCLPFSLTIANSPLAGADVRELSSASFADGVLDLEFTEEGSVTALEAGVPYIIKWASGSDIFEPRFDGVTLSNELKDKVIDLGDGMSITFKGTYAPITYTNEDKSVLLVGEGSTLYYPLTDAYVNAQRAYFQLDGIEVGTVDSNAIGLRFGDATRINNVLNNASDAVYYDLSGRCVKGQPTEAGIYIVNGKKVVIK